MEPPEVKTRQPANAWQRGRFRARPRRAPPGSAPGTLAPPAEALPPRLQMIAYGPEVISEAALETVPDAGAAPAGAAVVWIDVQGLGDLELIRRLGEAHGLHLLTIADIAHANQQPKVEIHPGHLFVVLRMPQLHDGRLALEQLSLIVGDGFVLTFQEWPGDCFDPVRARLRQAQGRIRTSGADYLAYALVDALLDSAFPVLEDYGEQLEQLEEEVLRAPEVSVVGEIHRAKRELLQLRRTLWPLRDVIGTLLREDTPFIAATTRPFLRDCADHVFQLMDMVEIDREVALGLIDLHLSSVGTRLNEIMKVLTMIATIFIPLGFIAGIYGMNFDPAASPLNMPELEWYFGYPFALALMAAVALGLLAWFWQKGWFGREGRRRRE